MALKAAKYLRNAECVKTLGPDYEYGVDVYQHRNAATFVKEVPMDVKDCVKAGPKPPDSNRRYFKNVQNREQCAKLKGVWHPDDVSRDNYIDDGVCWTNPRDAQCQVHANKIILAERAKPSGTVPVSGLRAHSKVACTRDPSCTWLDKEEDCASKVTLERAAQSKPIVLPTSWPRDITRAFNPLVNAPKGLPPKDFAHYLELYFSGALDQKPPRFNPLNGVGDRCNTPQAAAQPQENLLSMHQAVVATIMKGMATKPTKNRGLLCWHSVGSGKTNTAMAIMEAFWDTKKKIVFTSSVEALANNPPITFMELALKFFPRFQTLTEHEPAPAKKLDIVKQAFEDRGVQFMSFAQLAHYALIARPLKMKNEAQKLQHQFFLNDTVLIIDEVHNIFKPLPTQALEHNALRKFLADYKNPYTKELQIAILTATPGESPSEIVDLLNMVRDKTAPPIVVPNFQDPQSIEYWKVTIRGLISYFDISSDYTKFPVVSQAPEYILPMSMEQYRRYVEAYRTMTSEVTNFSRLEKEEKLTNYLKPARKYSNMLYDYEKPMQVYEFSAKLAQLLNTIAAHPTDKHYVYSQFYENRGYGGQGVLAIAKFLEDQHYTRLTIAEAIQINKSKTLPPLKRRYFLATTTELKHGKLTMGECLRELLQVFNHPQNNHGDYVQIMLASNQFNEGVDLKAIRHIHIFEPLLSANKEIQTIGRASRYCSHKDLKRSKQEWTVTVHRYLSEFPGQIQIMDIDGKRQQASAFEEDVLTREADLAAMKGQRGPEAKARRDMIKQHVAEVKDALKTIKAEIKELEVLDPSKIKMVDPLVVREVRDRYKNIGVMLTAMKAASVDCRLFSAFHNASLTGDNKYACL